MGMSIGKKACPQQKPQLLTARIQSGFRETRSLPKLTTYNVVQEKQTKASLSKMDSKLRSMPTISFYVPLWLLHLLFRHCLHLRKGVRSKSQGRRLKRLLLPKRSCKTLIRYKALLIWYFPAESNTKTNKTEISPIETTKVPMQQTRGGLRGQEQNLVEKFLETLRIL